ncbi:MAG: DUF6526 family protein [Acidobacteriota bacterium]|nr:DUF6526 family protein [Acidobacteriota bacterium]
MSTVGTQSYANHARWDPPVHFFLLPMLLVAVGLAIWNVIRDPGLPAAVILILALCGFLTALKARMYPLKAQDRVIRLEERLRLATLLPDSLRSRIGDLTESQLISLRFASDSELPALVEKTLADNWRPKQIKAAIAQWRPDHFRV